MCKIPDCIHRVSVVFKPEGNEKFSTEEQISFSTKQEACRMKYRVGDKVRIDSGMGGVFGNEPSYHFANAGKWI